MGQQVRGVVSRAKGEPVTIETIEVPDPGPGEAVVAVKACGVCHTDLHYREGAINDEFPFLLGHEAAGVVESVGDGVEDLEPGDYVILAWRAPCGTCRSCVRGQALVLLRVQERGPAHDPGRRPAEQRPRHRGLRREDPRPRQAVREGRPGRPARSRRPDRLRRDGRLRCGRQHRRGAPGRDGGRLRLRRRRQRRDPRRLGGRGPSDHRRRPRRPEAGRGPRASAPPTRSTPRPATRSRPSRR